MKNKIILLLFLIINLTLNGFSDKKSNQKKEEDLFKDYKEKADLYLSRKYFKGTPIKGEMLLNSAKKAYDSTGIIIPIELVLSQAQWESGMGLKGRSPKTNPFNIGEYGYKTVFKFKTTQEGIDAYYYLLTTKYLKCRSVDELLKNFVNCNGNRYAYGKKYEARVKKQYYFIKKWLNENYLTNNSTHGLTIQNMDN